MRIKNMTIITGITSSGDLTLGNYIGVIKKLVELQNYNNLIIFVANLHAITIDINKTELQKNIKNLITWYYACGLKPKKTIIFIQSEILAHTQLAHILLCNTTIGELSRMTQYKDKIQNIKSKNKTKFIPTGLLTYPILMAADILLYYPDFVLVGKDQTQHIELTKNIAKKMNNKYNNNLFKIPQELIIKIGNKIMDLQDPYKKMSKSTNNKNSFITLLDSPEQVKNKIKQAKTDSENKIYYNPKNKPGISNLLIIYSSLKEITISKTVEIFKHTNYNDFKDKISEIIIEILNILQKKYYKLQHSKLIYKWINKSTKKAKNIANKNIENIKNIIGINYSKK